MIKLSDYIVKRLKEIHNVKRIYLVPGGGSMHLNDSIGQHIEFICNHHEQGCAFAAEGQARYSGELAVVNTTSGPGALNAVTGVFGQWTDSVPVLYISGQIKFETSIASCPEIPLRQLGDQEVDIISIVKPITKYSVMITEPKEIKYHIDKAIYEATTGRKGPVWLDIPLNVQGSLIDENDLIDFVEPQKQKYDLKINETIEKIKNAKRPVIVAGYGIRISKTEEIFKKLFEKLNIPVLTTFNGVDLIEDNHPNYVGRIGTIGQRAGNFALQNADCVLFLGTRNNIRQISYNWQSYCEKAFKISVDIDKAELDKKTLVPDLKINADLAEFLPALLETIGQECSINFDNWLNWCKERKEKYSYKNTQVYQQKGEVINPYHFVHKLTEMLKDDDTIVTANGSACVLSFQVGVIKEHTRMFYNSGNATMGYDIPAAIGACLAKGKKQVICLAGDGSIMMNLQELQTIRHHNLPIKIFVINNDGYISMKQTQANFFDGRLTAADSSSGLTCPDFTEVGKGFKIKSITLENPREIEKTIQQVLDLNEPVICEVIVEKHYNFEPKLSSKKLEDGTLVSSRLEDMFPFLDREEFKGNMIND